MAKALRTDVEALQRGAVLHQSGDVAGAAEIYRWVLNANPRDFNALRLLGVVELQLGNLDKAESLIAKSVRYYEKSADAHYFLARICVEKNARDRAVFHLKKCIALEAGHLNGLITLACLVAETTRPQEAIQWFDRALAIDPSAVDALFNYGKLLARLRRHQEAIACYDKVVAIRPNDAEAFANRGLVLHEVGRFEEALASYEREIAISPTSPDAFMNRGVMLQKLRRYDDALASYDRATALDPDQANTWVNRGIALRMLGRHEEALACYDKAVAISPRHPQALYNRAVLFSLQRRYEEATADYRRVLASDPDYKYAFGMLVESRLHACDWAELPDDIVRLRAVVSAGKPASDPFAIVAISPSPQEQLICARTYAADRYPPRAGLVRAGRTERNRIRVAYMSGEFREQATSYLTAELFEIHDRTRFEISAVSTGANDRSAMRARLEAAFDKFIDASEMSDRNIAEMLVQSEIDILVNLNGYFGVERTGVFAMRPCPIQVNYLGFPGTMGADYMDYIIADRQVLPEDQRSFYSEKVVYLPEVYQANDSTKHIDERVPTRAELGLPNSGFVFCCFNNNHKIMPEIFDIWCRLLREVEGSVLWLLEANAAAGRNLRQEAEKRGVPAERIVFAPPIPLAKHLARIRAADLFLDTLPHNAHTTTSDALWAGAPVLTCVGSTFAGRVAGSLLQAIGLPELTTNSLDAYEALATRIARDPSLLQDFKAKLARNRGSWPLFASDRFRRHLESAYVGMWERFQRGEGPASFSVDPID
jgi:protein O-GlcNAc transferase